MNVLLYLISYIIFFNKRGNVLKYCLIKQVRMVNANDGGNNKNYCKSYFGIKSINQVDNVDNNNVWSVNLTITINKSERKFILNTASEVNVMYFMLLKNIKVNSTKCTY